MTTEVRAKLTLEDEASASLANIKDGIEGAAQAEKKAQGGLVEYARSFREVYEAGRYALDTIKGVAEALTGNATQGEVADHALAGLVSTVQGIPWQEALSGAQSFGDELDNLAKRTGTATGDVEAGFHALAEEIGASKAGITSAKFQIESLSEIGGALGKSVEGMAREVGFMGEGMLRTKGQMFQLLQSVGVFSSSAKKAKEEWAKLDENDRTVKLEEGLQRIAHNVAQMPKTFQQTKTSLAAMVDIAKEKIGEPLIESLAPFVKDLTDLIHDELPTFVSIAKTVADLLHPLFTMIKGVLVYWVANKVFTVGAGLAGAVGKAGGAVVSEAAKGGISGLAGAGVSGLAGLIGPQGAFGLLSVSAFALVESIKGLVSVLNNSEESTANMTAMSEALHRAARSGADALRQQSRATLENIDAMRKLGTLREHEAAMLRIEVELLDTLNKKREVEQALARGAAARAAGDAMLEAMGEFRAAFDNMNDAIATDAVDKAAVIAETGQDWVAAYNFAQEKHDQGLTTYLLTVLEGSKELQGALLQSGDTITGGMSTLADNILKATDLLGSRLHEGIGLDPKFTSGYSKRLPGSGGKAPSSSVFGGPTNITIKQEFREQDPDRIALVFRRDLMKAAERRYSAASPFGTSGG